MAESVAVGIAEGVAVGVAVGLSVGATGGGDDGMTLGVPEGLSEFAAEGAAVGVAVGADVHCPCKLASTDSSQRPLQAATSQRGPSPELAQSPPVPHAMSTHSAVQEVAQLGSANVVTSFSQGV